jgi:3-deoxy-D-manno-octulosonic-acid transferase
MSSLALAFDRFAYRMLLTVLSPLLLLVAWHRGANERGLWRFLRERFGFVQARHPRSIWVHAVSVGEVQAAATLLRALRREYAELPLVVTTGTATGAARARAILGEEALQSGAATVCFLPLDLPGCVDRFFARIRPCVALIVEKEIWPTLFRGCLERGITLVLASATLSPRSTDRYRRLWRLCGAHTRESLWVAAQSSVEAERFRRIGVPQECIAEVGNLKFDSTPLADAAASRLRLRAAYGVDAAAVPRAVVVAGSTYEAEESALLAAQAELAATGCDFLLVLAPRHPQRFEAVAARLTREGRHWLRRSQAASATTRAGSAAMPQVLLLDTLGELAEFYAMAEVAYVGGTLVAEVGGHNVLEPASLGVPMLAGPHGYNAPALYAALREAGGLVIVEDAEQLTRGLRAWLVDPAAAAEAGRAAQAFVAAHRGGLERLLRGVAPLIVAAKSRSASR